MAALFLALSPSFIFWGNDLFTEIPASFFGLLSVYLFFQRKYFWSGIVGGTAFFTKFIQLIPAALLGSIYAFNKAPVRISVKFFKFAAGFILLILPFLIFHLFMYGHAFYPFFEGKTIYGQISYRWSDGILSCLNLLLSFENWIFIFIPLSIIFPFKSHSFNKQKLTIIFAALLFVMVVGKVPNESLRSMTSSLPYLYLLSADGIIKGFQYLKEKNKTWRFFLIALVFLCLATQFHRIKTMRSPNNELDPFQEYVLENEEQLKDSQIWISNPTTLVFSHLKPRELMYYPIFDLTKIVDLRSKLSRADLIFWDSGALACVPREGVLCQRAKEELLAEINQNFEVEISKKNVWGKIIYAIFKR